MAVLGIESSAHTLGIGVVERGRVVANEKVMYRMGNKGMIPSKVADFHANNLGRLLDKALPRANLSINEIDAIGYTKGPGIGSCLRIGQLAARALSARYGIPLFDVNHAVAHIEITKRMFGLSDPLVLYVSGGNSQILAIENDPFRHYHVYGETFDIGIGNMLDSFARAAGLDPAWGSSVARAAEGGSYIELPYTVKGMDFTFTGLLTSAVKALNGNALKDVAYSLQETSFAMLCEAAERALLLTSKKGLILCGGVAQSVRLRQMLGIMARTHRARFCVAGDEFNADNGAMIALVAEEMLEHGVKSDMGRCTINQRYRIDSVRLAW
jgi:N6-L-threonylcarbamoyladenine synthase